MSRIAYMDYNAMAPIVPAAKQAMVQALDCVGNPSSVHAMGRKARNHMEDARDCVAALVNVRSDWVYFTSGGTEADALAINGCGAERILVSAVEHAAVLTASDRIENLEVDQNGIVLLDALEKRLSEDNRSTLVSVMAANNETGVIQPIAQIVEIAHRFGALVHCDAVQAVGKIDFDMQALGCDLVSLSAHKIGGPQGVGALVKRPKIKLQAQLRGGGQERSLRGGTENLIGIIGFGAAAKEKTDLNRVKSLRDHLELQIKALSDEIIIFGEAVSRLPNTSCFALPGMSSERQVMALDLAGIMVSAGSACSSGKVKSSHVLQAMSVAEDVADSAIRVSLGWQSTEEDIDMFVQAYAKLVERVQEKKSKRSDAA
jgi:cysteine desulfurase